MIFAYKKIYENWKARIIKYVAIEMKAKERAWAYGRTYKMGKDSVISLIKAKEFPIDNSWGNNKKNIQKSLY